MLKCYMQLGSVYHLSVNVVRKQIAIHVLLFTAFCILVYLCVHYKSYVLLFFHQQYSSSCLHIMSVYWYTVSLVTKCCAL